MAQALFNQWLTTQKRCSQNTAIYSDTEIVSFLSLHNMITELENKISVPLDSLNNRVVIFSYKNSPHWLATFLFCQKHNAIALPIENDFSKAAFENLIESIKPALFINENGIQLFEEQKRYQKACLIKATSGSTGEPKCFFFKDEEMIADANNICLTMGLKSSDSNLGLIPFGHSYGLGNIVLPFIMNGIPIVITSDFYPHSLSEVIQKYRPSVFPAVPPLLHALTESAINTDSLSSLRLTISAGSILKPELAKAYFERFGKLIHNFYGSSETGGIAYDSSGQCAITGEGIGTALRNVEVSVHKNRLLNVCSEAVYTKGNKSKKDGKGCHFVSDVGKIDSNFRIHLEGRKNSLIKIAGRRVDLREIETALLMIPEIEQAFVTTRQKGIEPRVIAVVQTQTHKDELILKIRQKLPKWKCPYRWIILAKFPLNARGKPDRIELNRTIDQ